MALITSGCLLFSFKSKRGKNISKDSLNSMDHTCDGAPDNAMTPTPTTHTPTTRGAHHLHARLTPAGPPPTRRPAGGVGRDGGAGQKGVHEG